MKHISDSRKTREEEERIAREKQEALEAEQARKTANKSAVQDKPKINKQKTRKEIEALERVDDLEYLTYQEDDEL